jgi:hypothetical protein
MTARRRGATIASAPKGGRMVWWVLGAAGVIAWILMLLTVGRMTLRAGYRWLFAFGLLVPILWIVGALKAPRDGGPTFRAA